MRAAGPARTAGPTVHAAGLTRPPHTAGPALRAVGPSAHSAGSAAGTSQPKRLAGLDAFRLPAALLVAAIHTAPLSGVAPWLDALVTYTFGRVAVPFFVMVSGYFVLGPFCWQRRAAPLKKFLLRNTLLYLAAVALYLPLNLYAKNLPRTFGAAVRAFFWEGTFYHLWYFPALLLGCCLTAGLWRLWRPLAWGWAAGGWLFGLLGDSWYGATAVWPALRALYDSPCPVTACTRNSLLYMPLFLLLGAAAARPGARLPRPGGCRRGLAVFVPLLAAEGLATWAASWQRHNSMYLTLAPAVWFLFCLLLAWRPGKWGARLARAGGLSGDFYLLHPAVIVLVRGAAKPLKLTGLLVENAFIHWLTVSLLCLGLCAGLRAGRRAYRQKRGAAR